MVRIWNIFKVLSVYKYRQIKVTLILQSFVLRHSYLKIGKPSKFSSLINLYNTL